MYKMSVKIWTFWERTVSLYACDFRLGGGLFGDTYVAMWNDRNVAVKRITIGVHKNQLQDEHFEWMRDETAFLR